MFYTIYKITNKINEKIYIGKHQTKDLNDGYMGSGKHLKNAIEKYGIENFEKEILFQFDNETDMNTKEAELVTEEFAKEDTNYNICPGGKGGWGYINSNGLSSRFANYVGTEKHKRWAAKGGRKTGKENITKAHLEGKIRYDTFTGKKHTDETRHKMSQSKKNTGLGKNNSQFGTMWITNGQENKKIKKDTDVIPEGWYKGRKRK
jgi:hypothetical protein